MKIIRSTLLPVVLSLFLVNFLKAMAIDLNIMLIVSFGQSGFNSSGVVPAADIALEDINRTPDLLPGYTLKYDKVRDSQVCAKCYVWIMWIIITISDAIVAIAT